MSVGRRLRDAALAAAWSGSAATCESEEQVASDYVNIAVLGPMTPSSRPSSRTRAA